MPAGNSPIVQPVGQGVGVVVVMVVVVVVVVVVVLVEVVGLTVIFEFGFIGRHAEAAGKIDRVNRVTNIRQEQTARSTNRLVLFESRMSPTCSRHQDPLPFYRSTEKDGRLMIAQVRRKDQEATEFQLDET